MGSGRGSPGPQRPPVSSHCTSGCLAGVWHWAPQPPGHLQGETKLGLESLLPAQGHPTPLRLSAGSPHTLHLAGASACTAALQGAEPGWYGPDCLLPASPRPVPGDQSTACPPYPHLDCVLPISSVLSPRDPWGPAPQPSAKSRTGGGSQPSTALSLGPTPSRNTQVPAPKEALPGP